MIFMNLRADPTKHVIFSEPLTSLLTQSASLATSNLNSGIWKTIQIGTMISKATFSPAIAIAKRIRRTSPTSKVFRSDCVSACQSLRSFATVEIENGGDSSNVDDLTLRRDKLGTPSPWAVFDAWGAGADICEPLSPTEETKLTDEAVKIPMSENESLDLPKETEILQAYDRLLQQKSSVHFGYPYNLMYDHSELYSFMQYSINNLGDPFVPSNYGVHSRQFECAVIDFFAKLWKMEPDTYWGYVTTSGTEGNLHGILLARECHPDGILYTSKETHYSVFKAARYYRMDSRIIPTLPTGEINYNLLAKELDKNRDHPAIINVNIGTTVKGAVDNLDRVLDILQRLRIPRKRFHIHCDGALFALMNPFVESAPEISFQKPIDSIAVSGHKMLGCPMPCGVALSRKEHVQKVEQHIDYLNSVDTTIMGSRNGQAALYMWYSLRKKGISGIKRDVL